MEVKRFRKKIFTLKHMSVTVCLVVLGVVFYLNGLSWSVYIFVALFVLMALQSYKIDRTYLMQGNFVSIPIASIDKLFIKESGSVVVYYSKPYKEKEYTSTLHPVDTEGFVAALLQVNEEMTILRENS